MTDIDLHFDVRAVRIIWRRALLVPVHLDNDRTYASTDGTKAGRGQAQAGRGQRDAEERTETCRAIDRQNSGPQGRQSQ